MSSYILMCTDVVYRMHTTMLNEYARGIHTHIHTYIQLNDYVRDTHTHIHTYIQQSEYVRGIHTHIHTYIQL